MQLAEFVIARHLPLSFEQLDADMTAGKQLYAGFVAPGASEQYRFRSPP